MPGQIPEPGKASRLLCGFDLLIMPSRKEGLPYVIIEAGMSGIPVVATPVGGIPELIEHNVSGCLTDPNDTETFALAIDRLRFSPETRKQFSENQRSRILSEYTLEHMLAFLIDVYETRF
jgi:glycosyltransferase involved in cell wall biosynthesis